MLYAIIVYPPILDSFFVGIQLIIKILIQERCEILRNIIKTRYGNASMSWLFTMAMYKRSCSTVGLSSVHSSRAKTGINFHHDDDNSPHRPSLLVCGYEK